MLKCHRVTSMIVSAAALLAMSGPSNVMAQEANGANDTYIGGFNGPAAQPSWPINAGVSTGTYGVGVGAGNGSAAVGAGSVGSGNVNAIGASTALPSTKATSVVPETCVLYPGVDVSANCQRIQGS